MRKRTHAQSMKGIYNTTKPFKKYKIFMQENHKRKNSADCENRSRYIWIDANVVFILASASTPLTPQSYYHIDCGLMIYARTLCQLSATTIRHNASIQLGGIIILIHFVWRWLRPFPSLKWKYRTKILLFFFSYYLKYFMLSNFWTLYISNEFFV